MMKKLTLFLALILGVVTTLSTAAGQPARAQEDLDTILARSAAKGFLATLTRPELTGVQEFYLTEDIRAEGLLSQLGDVTGYEITASDWVTPGQTYQVEARLQPGNRQLIVGLGQYNHRWRIDGLELPASGPAGSAAAVSSAAASGPQPVSGNGSGLLAFQTTSGGDIYVINADGTGLRRVTHGIDPQLSPDATQITFTRWDPRYELFTINIDGTNERAWFSNRRQMKSPTWSADGSEIVFSYQAGGRLEGDRKSISLSELAERQAKGEQIDRIPDNARGIEIEDGTLKYFIPPDAHWWLAKINLAREEYTDLSTGTRYNYAPVGHPLDPNKFVFRGDKGMAVYDDTSQISQPVSYDDRDRGGISISPDGSKVAFTYNQDGHWEIHTINIDGTNRQRLTKTPLEVIAGLTTANNEVFVNEEGFRTMSRAQPGSMPNLNWNNAAPVWSPDGSKIAFMTDRTGQWEIWIMNADGSDQRPMFPNGALDGIPLQFNGVDERMISWQ